MGFVSAIIKGATKEAAKSTKKLTKAATKAKGLATRQDDYSFSASLPKKESDVNFTSAFKDTTIIDKEGKPEVVYHGRVQDYDSFDTSGKMSTGKELGTHFGTKEQTDVFTSKEGGNVVPVYLNIKNPYQMIDSGSFNGEDIIEQLVEDGLVDSSYIDDLDLPIQELTILAKKLLKEKGFDGISYINTREGLSIKGKPITSQKKIDELQDYDLKTLIDTYGAKKSYIILEPEQAKSVFNKGSWNSKDKRFNYAKGGNVEQMNKLLGDGGMMDDSGEQVNGVEVPVGSLKEEVADDIPAQLSEGEFVVPADVVRFIGLEKLMQLRDKAKEGLLRMEEMGQMGNAQEVENPDQSFMQEDEDFSSEIDDIMAEDEPAGFRTGGFITGADISRVPSNPAVAVGYYKHTDGRMMWITKINGKPMSAPPDGFSEVSAEEFQSVGKKAEDEAKAATKPSTSTGMTGGGDGSYGDGTTPSGSPSSPSSTIGTGKGLQVGTPTLSPFAQAALATVAPITAVPLAFMNKANAQTNANNAAMTADSFAGVGGLSQAGITAANAAMAAESGRFGFGDNAPTPGSVAAAGASAGSAVNNTNAMDAMMGAIQADKGTPGTASPPAPSAFNPDAVAVDRGGRGGEATNSTNSGNSGSGVAAPGAGTAAGDAAGNTEGSGGPADGSGTAGGQSTDAAAGGFDIGSSEVGGASGAGDSGRYCCSRMVHHGLWDVNHEFARLTVWSRRQPNWWRSGYPVWGKVIAKNLLQEEGFWTDVMQAFYDAKVRKQPRTIKSTIAEIVIYPGAFVCGMIYKDIPTKATLADPSEFI